YLFHLLCSFLCYIYCFPSRRSSDLKKYIRTVRFFTVVGMNSLFIYVFVSIGGSRFIRTIVDTFTRSVFEDLNELSVNILSAIVVDRKSTRLNSSHVKISYADLCLKK